MRNSFPALAAFAVLALAAMPAAAETDEGSCAISPSATSAGPIDLQAIPVQDPSAPKIIKGGEDGCGDRQGDEAEDDD